MQSLSPFHLLAFWMLLGSPLWAEPFDAESLVSAVVEDRTEDLKELLAKRTDSTALSDALAVAARTNRREATRLLLIHEADPNQASSRYGNIPALTMAVHFGHRELAKDLWRQGAKPESPLIVAAPGLDETLADAIKRDPRLLTDRSGNDTATQPLLHVAAMHSRLSTMRMLLEQGAAVNLADSRGVTALHIAALHGRREAVEFLLANGADIHARTKLQFIAGLHAGCFTPMHFAFAGGHADIVDHLLESGSRQDEPSFPFNQLLAHAIRRRHRSLVDVLVGRVNEGEWPVLLNDAVKNDWDLVIESLIRSGVDPTEQLWGAPIHWALAHGHTELAELLIAKGADVQQIHNGGTPLSETAQRGDTRIMWSLLKRKAAVDIGTVTGTTPLQFAVFHGDRDGVELLLESGADPGRIQSGERSALAESTDPARIAILELLRQHEVRRRKH